MKKFGTYAYSCFQYISHSKRTLDQIHSVANTLSLGMNFHQYSPNSKHMKLELKINEENIIILFFKSKKLKKIIIMDE